MSPGHPLAAAGVEPVVRVRRHAGAWLQPLPGRVQTKRVRVAGRDLTGAAKMVSDMSRSFCWARRSFHHLEHLTPCSAADALTTLITLSIVTSTFCGAESAAEGLDDCGAGVLGGGSKRPPGFEVEAPIPSVGDDEFGDSDGGGVGL